MRLVITGSPKSGKTTLAHALACVLKVPVYHTDDLKEEEWSVASEKASYWFARPDPWIIEGTMVPRALRKYRNRLMDEDADSSRLTHVPFDRMVVMRTPRIPLELQGQRTMQKTVLELIDSYRGWIGEARWVEL